MSRPHDYMGGDRGAFFHLCFTGLFADFQGVQKREEAPVEGENSVGRTEKVFPPVTVPPTALGGEEHAQEWEKERAKSSFHLVHVSSLLSAETWASICQIWSLMLCVAFYVSLKIALDEHWVEIQWNLEER